MGVNALYFVINLIQLSNRYICLVWGVDALYFAIDLIQLLKGISMALELSLTGTYKHQRRVALISEYMAGALNMNAEEKRSLVCSALIHDIGIDLSCKQQILLSEDKGKLYEHAEEGYQLLKDSNILGFSALAIRHHHDFWNGSGDNPFRLVGEDIPLISRIICLADTIEVQTRDDMFIFEQCPSIMQYINQYSGILFDPHLVNVLNELSRIEAFWLDITNPDSFQNFFDNISIYGKYNCSLENVMEIADILANIVDRNNSSTGRHSYYVAVMAAYLAKKKGFCDYEVKRMRIAGALHDLGKLAISNKLLANSDKLTEMEFYIIKQHPYYTYQILQSIDGFRDITEWASYHHETLDGEGYPFHLQAKDLSLGSRIVAVADIFTALTEKRAYHSDFSWNEVKSIMHTMVIHHKIDGDLVNELFSDKESVLDLSRNILIHKDSSLVMKDDSF